MSEERLDRPTILALVAMGIAVFVIANDITALTVALPQIEADFDSGVSTVQWVINAYALVFGVLIVTGGRLADLFGRRLLFFVGAAIFAAFSLLGGLAQDDIWLIICRAAMGVGGAIMWPATLGMTFAILPKAKAGIAGGLIIGCAGFGNAAGPLIGGLLTDALSWRWILFVNIPIAAIACLVTWRTVPETRGGEEERRIDYLGIATLSLGLVALLVALDEAADRGWLDWRILALLGVCVVLLVAFVFAERRAGEHALVPADVARNGPFRAACVAVLCMSPTFFAALMFLPQLMQKLLDFSAVEAGAGFLPMMGTFAAVSFAAGPLYQRLGAKIVVTSGAACLFVGMLLFSLIEADSGYLALVPGMVVFGLGVGLFYSSVTTAGVTALDDSRSSLAGGIVYMCQVAGGSIGLGLTTSIFASVSGDRVSSDAAAEGIAASPEDLDAVHGVLAGTESSQQVLAQFPGDVADRLVEIVRDAFVAGMQWGFRVDTALALLGLVVSVLFVGGTLWPRHREGRLLDRSAGLS
jgi:EmrB/QacA subfamily drug resistance transporter